MPRLKLCKGKYKKTSLSFKLFTQSHVLKHMSGTIFGGWMRSPQWWWRHGVLVKGSQFEASSQPPMFKYAGGLRAPSESSSLFVCPFQTRSDCVVELWLRPALWIALVLTLGNVEGLLRTVLYSQIPPLLHIRKPKRIDTHMFSYSNVFQ